MKSLERALFCGCLWSFLAIFLVSCHVLEPEILDADPVLPGVQEELPRQEYLFTQGAFTSQEAQYWVETDLNALYFLVYPPEYLEFMNLKPEDLESRQSALFSPQISWILERLWAEYPDQECRSLALDCLGHLYENIQFQVKFAELEVQTGDYLMHIQVKPLEFPSHIDQDHIQAVFDLISQNVEIHKLSQESYEFYDGQTTRALLDELCQVEEFSYGESVDVVLRLSRVEEGYGIFDLSPFHSQVLA